MTYALQQWRGGFIGNFEEEDKRDQGDISCGHVMYPIQATECLCGYMFNQHHLGLKLTTFVTNGMVESGWTTQKNSKNRRGCKQQFETLKVSHALVGPTTKDCFTLWLGNQRGPCVWIDVEAVLFVSVTQAVQQWIAIYNCYVSSLQF